MRRLVAALALPLAALFLPSGAAPAVPHDPCARAGRDSCGTLGVGFYRVSRYGLRWFGDYRGAVRGAKHLFCIDLGYWYASPAYRYRPQAGPLRDRAGRLVPAERRRRIAYAVWRYGRSGDPRRQAAVMLYVHATMGDARPGELDPAALGPRVAALYSRIARDTARLHGPYRIEARLPASLRVGRPARATIRVVSAHGAPLPYVRLRLSADGAAGAPARAETNAAGLARVPLTPTTAGSLRLRLATAPLAAPVPHVLAPTAPGARERGQRLALPAGRAVTATVTRTDVGASPRITTQASAQETSVGAEISDTVTVSGLGGASLPVEVRLWGPFASRSAIACTGTPLWQGSFVAHGNGTTTTTPVRLAQAGWYAFGASIAARPPNGGYQTACAETSETTFARARPSLASSVSTEVVRPGSASSTRLAVRGLGTTRASVEVEVFGPFPTLAAARCSYPLLRSQTRIAVAGDSTVSTPRVELRRPGFYVYRARLLGTPLVAGVTTSCTAGASTVLAAPRIVTGRGDAVRATAAAAAGPPTPVRVEIPGLAIDARVTPSGIDLHDGVLGVPADIHRVGWWRDGSAPGAAHGTTLIAGHRDSARDGAGAFFRLEQARAGTAVSVTTTDGARHDYRVAAVRRYAKAALPLGVFARSGRARLVLVTCGGPFDAATGHYADDVVVTAVPAR